MTERCPACFPPLPAGHAPKDGCDCAVCATLRLTPDERIPERSFVPVVRSRDPYVGALEPVDTPSR